MDVLKILLPIAVTCGIVPMENWLIFYKGKTSVDVLSEKKRNVMNLLLVGSALLVSEIAVACSSGIISGILLTAFTALLAVCMGVDIRVHIIPNICLLPMLCAAVVYLMINWPGTAGFLTHIGTALAFCYGMLLAAKLVHAEALLGAGDIKLITVVSLLFGMGCAEIVMFAGMILSLLAYVVPMMMTKKMTLKSMVALGPFIGIGTMAGIVSMMIC